ncbi:calcium-binding protein [Kordiimonas aestuarii]|uniref:calcium-binding protein n=1 Tax=Kordiimonas aestuarii TaxID=1005925 RepID=UPI0021D08593|nr:hypothetical protein [Kordiimonas aestuarii]
MGVYVGTVGNDSLTGSESDDNFSGGNGSDYLSGGSGNDRFTITDKTGSWHDTVIGGEGTDRAIISLDGVDSLEEFSSITAELDDTLGLNYVLTDEEGNSITLAEVEEIEINGQVFSVSDGATSGSTIYSDYLHSLTSENLMVYGISDATATTGAYAYWTTELDSTAVDQRIIGTERDDVLVNPSGPSIPTPANPGPNEGYRITDDYIDGRDGDDDISAQYGTDTLIGGDGDDTIAVYDAGDYIDAGSGDDFVHIGLADPSDFLLLDGGDGIDALAITFEGDGAFNLESYTGHVNFEQWSLHFYQQTTTVAGTSADDIITLWSHEAEVSLFTGDGNDTIYGGGWSSDSAVSINAGVGDDFIYAYTHDATVFGGSGRDTIWGSFGDDTLDGGEGHDLLEGIMGTDVFVLRSGDSDGTFDDADEISSFTPGDDKIALDGISLSHITLTDEIEVVTDEYSRPIVVISVTDTNEIIGVVRDVTSTDFSASDFIALNDPLPDTQEDPTGRAFTAVLDEDTSHIFQSFQFSFRDTDPLDTLAAVIIDSLPATGVLLLDGIAVEVGTRVIASHLADGLLVYTPPANANGANLAAFSVRLEDNTGLLSESLTVTLDVTPVNDAPTTVRLSSSTVDENTVGAIIGTLSSNDIEGEAISYTVSDDRFEVVGDTLKLKDDVSLDFEMGSSIRLRVTAVDASGLRHSTFHRISVEDQVEVSPETLAGSAGHDSLVGGSANDLVLGRSGADTLLGANGNDAIGGGDGDDLLDGGSENDLLWGAAGNDILIGGNGNDTLFNGAGADTVDGGDGGDTIWAGQGNDRLSGQGGADRFVFGRAVGDDTVTDFDVSEDILDLRYLETRFDTVQAVIAASTEATYDGETGVLVDLGGGNSVFLIGLQVSDLASVTMVI